MNTTFEKYLDTIDKCLKPLPTSERVDIVKEIKGSILEMESENLSTEQILTRACLKIKNCTKHVFLSPFHDRIKKKGAFICQDVMN